MSKSPDPKALQHMTDPKAFQQVTDPKTRRQSSPPAGLVLAFDTAGETIALAVGRWSDGASILPLAADDHPAARQANVQLMPSVDTLFTEHSLAKSEITCMVCGLGPGSFTGVRIGVATAKGLARGLRVPLFGISTLDAIAWGAWLAGIRGTLGVIADAMRGEVYPLRFLLSDEGVVRLDPYTVAKAGDVAARWREAGEILLLVGDGLGKYAEVFEGQDFPFILGDATLWTPTGIGLLRAFEAAWVQGTLDSGEAGTLLPIYTRLSDAEENERRRLASGGPIVQGAAVEVPLSGVADPARAGAVVFRPMAAVDLDQVDVIEKAAFPGGAATSKERWTRAQLADDLTRTDRVWWVACVGDLLVGFAGGWVTGGELQVLDVAVDESRRRCGIAYKLLERLLQDAFNLGATTASLEVRESNKAARALYASLGFEQIGIRPSYYAPRESGSSREDAVILSLPLGPGGRGKCPTRLRRGGGGGEMCRPRGGGVRSPPLPPRVGRRPHKLG
ncbi:MAG: tRNA (adenosine(37)-N6)-threonylcarbamoyltransferase complex dimerization subunit type 1 TsaB, partial [Coriobacteriales bacterium]|nr:tRNA (adenosine(37)-N6)-threonylcarbamoyltransferase complex dimerization subunit type 1 TsaB [Coriobacteriales bacterium]